MPYNSFQNIEPDWVSREVHEAPDWIDSDASLADAMNTTAMPTLDSFCEHFLAELCARPGLEGLEWREWRREAQNKQAKQRKAAAND